MKLELPPLPIQCRWVDVERGAARAHFTADQMHAYARTAVRLALEAAANECERYGEQDYNGMILAARIRRLAQEGELADMQKETGNG